MKIERGQQFADLLVLAGLASMTGWYLWDSYTASSHVYNLILVLPLSIAILVLCGIGFVAELINPAPPKQELQKVADVFPVMALFFA